MLNSVNQGAGLPGFTIRPILVFAALVIAVSTGQCADFTLESYPLRLAADANPIRSTLYLQLEVKDYGVPLEKLSTQGHDAREQTLVKALQAIRSNDLATLSALWNTPKPAAKTGQTPPSQTSASKTPASQTPEKPDLSKLVALFHAIYGNMSRITVLNQALMGAKSVFIVEMDSSVAGVGTRRMGFEISPDSGGQLRVQSVTSNETPVENLFQAIMAAAMTDRSYAPQPGLTLKYRYAFPLEGKGNPGPHPVILQFSGEALNFRLIGSKDPAPDPVLKFFRDTYLLLEKRDLDAFIALHTSASANTMKRWTGSMNDKVLQKFYAKYGGEKYVKFLLNANPIYIVFYSADPSDQWSSDSLEYEYVLKNASGDYQLTNLNYQGYLDDILANNALFNLQIFKRAKPADQQPPAEK